MTTLPTGWKPMPAVMTLEMSVAFAETWYSKRRAIDDDDMQDAYAAMLAAAPTPPASAQDDAKDERQAFESWMRSQGLGTERHGYSYSLTYARRAWEAWQARASIAAPAAGDAQTAAIRDVLAERRHQVDIGYDSDHDDEHDGNEISALAAFYMMPPAVRDWPATETGYGDTFGDAIIPCDWHAERGQPRRHELVMAVAMGLAEIERLDRAAQQGKGGNHA